jgi:hypothetical protein
VETADDDAPAAQTEDLVSPFKVVAGISLVIAAGFSFTASNIIQASTI